MIISYEWLREYVEAPDVREVADRLTMAGFEVEAVRNPFDDMTGARVARVASMSPHPKAAGLSVCDLDAGTDRPVVVCGAVNVKPGDLVPWLPPDAITAGGKKVEEASIHGVLSRGMLASGEDLGIEASSAGIYVLPPGLTPGEILAQALGKGACVLDVNVTPNRGDCLCHVGIAREVAAIFGLPLKTPSPALTEAEESASAAISVSVRDAAGCPRYLARVLRDVTVGPSPGWLVRRLAAAGVRAINNVVDATNYVMLELGHPMHAFDSRRIRGGTIVVRRAGEGERIIAIDGVERGLRPEDLVIADGEGPVAVAGVMGGERSGIGGDTKDVVLECASFEPRGVRRTSSRLGLSSESSYRFERGVDPAGLERAVDRCAELIVASCGGRVLKGRVAGGGPVPPRRTVRLRPARLAAVAGATIPAGDALRILAALGVEKTEGDADSIEFSVPTARPDLVLEEDLIEEVLRLWGYDRVTPTLPANREFCAPERAGRDLCAAVRASMTAAGFQEIISYSFVAPGSLDVLGIPGRPLPIRNPLSDEQSVMRMSLLPGILSAASHNVRRRQKSLRLFELGRVFVPVAGAALPDEPIRLAGIVLGRREERSWTHPETDADFYDVKGAVESLCAALKAGPLALGRDGLPAHLHPGRGATVNIGGIPAGSLGQLHPGISAKHDLPEAAFVFDLLVDALTRASAGAGAFRPYADFPGVERDMAFLVDNSVPAGDLTAEIAAMRIAEVEGARVFDVYTGPQVGEGRKNVAIGICYRAADRTLTDAEVDAIHARIVAELNERFGGRLR
ncbi:MAG: phenylalanine--tRNA ligase subunit beta [Deltaproteobacteria bacterium]|nr:phenylalanine--tRNA ligase subunit beta [Deltaproteobacteria bacterium]